MRDKPAEQREPFKPGPELIGEWSGEIKTYEETAPVTLTIQPDGDVHVRTPTDADTPMPAALWTGTID